jgi:dihydroxyacetone kinase-like predicted kinase
MKEIDAASFKDICQRGMEHLFRERELLNRINVFPVADGDTGDNLVHTLKPLYEQIGSFSETRLDDLTARLAAVMLMSAKGNSGVIFSQFFLSFSKALKGRAAIGPADFSLAMERAVRETYESIAQPQEGTILTVLRHTAEEFKRLALNGEKYHVIFEKVIIKAREILERTRDILPQMKKARVVDAGGMGFYLFFKGMAAAVLGRGADGEAEGHAAFDQAPQALDACERAFCAEWVIRPRGRGKEFFKELLSARGDSVLVAGDADLLHLHIHTDDPEAVEE